MEVDLFAGVPVSDYGRALRWYARLLGSGPSFLPSPTEAVWELADHRFLYIEERPERAGAAMHTLFVGDLDALVEEIAGRGIDPVQRETYDNGVRKITYRDADGNEIGYGGSPRRKCCRLRRSVPRVAASNCALGQPHSRIRPARFQSSSEGPPISWSSDREAHIGVPYRVDHSGDRP
jgi:Glyoxalase-like domain